MPEARNDKQSRKRYRGSSGARTGGIPFSAHPVAGDFNGDGAEDLYLYERFTGDRLRWGDGRYLVRRGRSPQMELERVPLTGDFDGNDVDDVYRSGTEDLSDEV